MGNVPPSTAYKSHVVPDSAEEGKGPIHRSVVFPDKLIDRAHEDVCTLYQNFMRGVEKYPNNPCLGTRAYLADGKRGNYEWETYKTVGERIHNFASGLRSLGLEKGAPVGIYSINRAEYVIAEVAIYSQSMLIISLYDTLGAEAVVYILNQAEIGATICTKDKIPKLIELSSGCPFLKTIIQMESEVDEALVSSATAAGIRILTFKQVEEEGAANKVDPVPPGADDVSTIMYTSGTTGLPKGVLLTHKNVISALGGAITNPDVLVLPTDIHISYLPMAHIFERVIQSNVFGHGAACGFYQGNVTKLFEDIETLKPTIFASVPRLFNRLYDKANQTIASQGGIKKILFERGFKAKKEAVDQGMKPSTPIWDSIVFSKMKGKLGGRVRLMITGSAPISKEVFQFLQICFCCPVIQGYGLTETSAASCLTDPQDYRSGHVGPPIPCCEIRLEDVPEMNYFAKEDKGEICIRGNSVMIGYFKLPEKTAEVLDADGWFHTGDIGRWNKDGTLTLIDRKKNIFKLAQGEYVAPEYIENTYLKNTYVQQIFVFGDSLQACLVGIVVPDFDSLKPWAKSKGIPDEDPEALCANPDVAKFILSQMNQTAKESKLHGFEFVKAIHLEPSPFSIEKDLLTPTFKLRRNTLQDYYQSQIASLYEGLKAAEAAAAASTSS